MGKGVRHTHVLCLATVVRRSLEKILKVPGTHLSPEVTFAQFPMRAGSRNSSKVLQTPAFMAVAGGNYVLVEVVDYRIELLGASSREKKLPKNKYRIFFKEF